MIELPSALPAQARLGQSAHKVCYFPFKKNYLSFPDKIFSVPQASKALMKSPNLLQDIYEEWLEKDDSHMEDLRQTIADFKSYMVKTEKILSGKERWCYLLRSSRPYVQIDISINMWI